METKALLRRYHLQARKGLGQHFLIDDEVLKLIIAAAELHPTDVVLEIGPGLGILTREMARQAGRVVAVELDSRLASILEQALAPLGNVTIINEDVLKVEPAALLRESAAGFSPTVDSPPNYKVVANLPYYITSAVLRHFLETSVRPKTMVVMVQKEVGEVIVAAPGQMSLLSVSVQFYGKPRIISQVPARCFYPPPKVDSAILRIDLLSRRVVAVTDEKSFFQVVRAGFTTSRKQLANSLAQGLGCSKAETLSWLEKADIVPQRRAETLTLEEWARLWRVIHPDEAGK